MNNNIRTGIIGIFAILLGVSGTLVLQEGELDKAYVCDTTGAIGIFERLSSTARTAYPYAENNTESKLCGNNGRWITCNEYAGLHGTTCQEYVQAMLPVNPIPSGTVMERLQYCNRPSEGGFCVNATCFAD